MSEREKVEGVVVIHQPVEQYLNARQRIAYRQHRKDLIDWLATEANDGGYAQDTYEVYEKIICQFHRYVWDRDDSFELRLTHEDAEEYLSKKKEQDYSTTHLNNIKLALKAYFRFKDDEWDTDIKIEAAAQAVQPRDALSNEERRKLRQAVLEYGSIPAYAALDSEERTEWKRYLARRYGKKMKEVGKEDWDRANGFKYVTILNTSLDAGLRPVEVGRAKTYWVDTENAALRIPADESAKNSENWVVGLRGETATYLEHWLAERELYEKYDDTDRLWLTRHGNPYTGKSLKVLLDNLRGIADIEREFSWYAIRHSTGTQMAREEGLAAAQSQLRHLREETTMKYDNVSVEDRRDALNRMG